MKVRVMGVLVPEEDLPEDVPPPEYHFGTVLLSGRAIDRCSQVVPEDVWKPLGMHTWLQRRANEAFGKLTHVKEKEIIMGRLKYVFERAGDQPLLTTVILQEP